MSKSLHLSEQSPSPCPSRWPFLVVFHPRTSDTWHRLEYQKQRFPLSFLINRSSGSIVKCLPCNRKTGVQFPVKSYQRLIKKKGTHSLPAWHSASRVGLGGVLATYKRHVQGVYLYIKLPHATETGDRLLPYGPDGSRTMGGMVLKATSSTYAPQGPKWIGNGSLWN